MKTTYSTILGTGRHTSGSDAIVPNAHFETQIFYDAKGNILEKPTLEIIHKFEEITGTKGRHYAAAGKVTSTLAIEAGEDAIRSSGIPREEIDLIIVANNFGDITTPSDKIDLVPSYASRIKNYLQILNPDVVAYDISFGGPDCITAYKRIEEYLGLGTKDLVIHINDHEQEDMLEISEYLLPKCSVDKEQLNNIVVVHYLGSKPSLACKVRKGLGIHNSNTLAYDLYFGCPGFLQAMIHTDIIIKNNRIKKALIIGAEILSRVAEPEDMDNMLYADGAGAVIMGAIESEQPVGMIFHKVRSDTYNQQAFMIHMGPAYSPHHDPQELFLKMFGTRVHKYALNLIPLMIKEALKEAGLKIEDIAQMVFHQPNPLMLQEIARRTFAQFDLPVPKNIMPIIGDTYGNSSVACIPIILDRMYRNQLNNHIIASGDIIMLLSIGAGMNINIAFYKAP